MRYEAIDGPGKSIGSSESPSYNCDIAVLPEAFGCFLGIWERSVVDDLVKDGLIVRYFLGGCAVDLMDLVFNTLSSIRQSIWLVGKMDSPCEHEPGQRDLDPGVWQLAQADQW